MSQPTRTAWSIPSASPPPGGPGQGYAKVELVDTKGQGGPRVDIGSLPEEFRSVLANFDEDGSGDVSLDEIRKAASTYRDFKKSKGSYALQSFPDELQSELKAFDRDGDGTVSAAELGRACVLYRESKLKFQKAVKGASIIAVIAFLLLAANCGLVFAMVYIAKDTKVDSRGAMYTKNDASVPVSVGAITQIVSVHADKFAFSKLRNETFDAFATKPEAIGVTLADRSVFNFPVEWFESNSEKARLGNSQLGYTVTISKASGVEVNYPSNTQFSMQEVAVAKLRLFLRSGAALVADDDDASVIHEDLVAPKSTSAADAESAARAVMDLIQLIPLDENLNSELLDNPEAAASAGDPSEWMFELSPGSGAHADKLQVCCNIAKAYNGTCAPGFGMASTTDNLPVYIPRPSLMALRTDASMGVLSNPCGIARIIKVKRISSPAYHIMEPHEADPHQIKRHDEVKRMVFETHRGRRLLQHVAHRARVEGWYNPQRSAGRGLQEIRPQAGQSVVDAVLASQWSASADCYVGNKVPYLGNTKQIALGGGQYGTCLPWTAQDAPDSSSVGVSVCRKHPQLVAAGYDFPMCPYVASQSQVLSYYKCNVPHCVTSLFGSWGTAPLSLQNWYWGDERIATRDITYDIALDREAVTGAGVHCFIVDSGVSVNHAEFGPAGRVLSQYDAITNTDGQQVDENGHGTHVAGIVAGKEHGVAPGCSIHAVKVFGAQGSGGMVYKGIQWVVNKFAEIKKTQPNAKGVVNLSLGGARGDYWNAYVKSMTDVGLAVVVAAGNEDVDACTTSPAHVPEALTVGATYLDDVKTLFSNWGSCVKVFAPGAGIKSAKANTVNEYVWMGGTSMAAPFAAGAVALFFQVHPNATPAEAMKWIMDTATVGKVKGLNASVYKGYGMSDPEYSALLAAYSGSGLVPQDEAANIAATPENRLLYVPYMAKSSNASTPSLPGGTLATGDVPLCREANMSGYGLWTAADKCPPTGNAVPICGTRVFQAQPDLWLPVVKEVRACNKTKCICDKDSEERFVSCNPSKSNATYLYLENCGVPAAFLETDSSTTFLSGKLIRFSPVAGSAGTSYSSCIVGFDYTPASPNLPFPYKTEQGAKSLKSFLTASSSVQLSLPAGFKFYDNKTKTMQAFTKINVHPYGHVTFGDLKSQVKSGNFSLQGMFNSLKGPGINGLFSALAIDKCGLKSGDCGDVRIWVGSTSALSSQNKTKIVVTYFGVPTSGAKIDAYQSRNYFQIALNADDSGTFDLVYGYVSSLNQKAASYGVSFGQGKVPPGLVNPRTSPQCQ